MAIEIEKKYRLNELQKSRMLNLLKEFNVDFTGEDFEVNTIYGGGILDEKRAILRIRKTENKSVLTYKQRIKNNFDVKEQIEYETEISNAAETEKLVKSLGFAARLIYEKRRKTFKFRDVEIVLDELPFGDFMEIEGSVTAIAEAEMFLEIEDFETEHETYPSLTVRLGKINGKISEARF